MSAQVAKVELYNLWLPGRRFPTNGWYVARYVNDVRHQTLANFYQDEASARAFAAKWNREHAKRVRVRSVKKASSKRLVRGTRKAR